MHTEAPPGTALAAGSLCRLLFRLCLSSLVSIVFACVYRVLSVRRGGCWVFKKCILKPFSEKNALLYNQGSHSRWFFLSGAHRRATYTSCRLPIGTGGPEVQVLCAAMPEGTVLTQLPQEPVQRGLEWEAWAEGGSRMQSACMNPPAEDSSDHGWSFRPIHVHLCG